MPSIKIIVSSLLGLLLLVACTSPSNKSENGAPFAHINEDENFLGKTEKGKASLSLYYKPIEDLVRQDTINLKSTNKDSIVSMLKKQYAGTIYLVANIMYDGKSLDWLEGNKLPANLVSFDMEEKFSLVDKNGEELPLLNWHFVSTSGMAPYSQYFLAFSKNNRDIKELVFTFKEFGLDCGNLTIDITKRF